jgi:drug/metabolite transporter (DMT)-like permease
VQSSDTSDRSAKLMLIVLSFVWGTTWPAMRIALEEIPPFSMRVVSLGLGAAALLATVKLQGRSYALARRTDVVHVIVGGILNIIGFTMLSAFALLLAATTRVTILAYTMPIWAALFSWLVLGERLNVTKVIALALCCAGMVVLIYPLAQHGIPLGLLLAVGTGVAWAAGTVYVKWARIQGDIVAVAAWQLVVGFVIVTVCVPLVEGTLHVTQAHTPAILGTIYTGLIGSAFAYFLWFSVIGRLSAMTASLGLLSVPLIGVLATAVVLGERPTAFDLMGFVLIFAASVCVMLPSRS